MIAAMKIPSRLRALITGVTGFAGMHLAEMLLADAGVEVWGMWHQAQPPTLPSLRGLQTLPCDLREPARVREVLADLLWDERSQTQAQGNLRWLLTRLGQQLAPYLTVTRTTVAFNLNSPHWLDVADLEHHLDRARMSHPRGDSLTPVAVQELESGAALYDGPFLHGFYVRPQWWGTGVADELHDAACDVYLDGFGVHPQRLDYHTLDHVFAYQRIWAQEDSEQVAAGDDPDTRRLRHGQPRSQPHPRRGASL